MENLTLTVEEASKIASVGINQMYQAVREGKIPSLRIGRRILIPRRKFIAMLSGEEITQAGENNAAAL